MSTALRIAIAFDLDRADHATRQLVAGIVRYANEAGNWHCVFEPLTPRQRPGPCDGLLGPGRVLLDDHARQAGIPYVAVTAGAISRSGIPHVVESRHAGASLAAKHLLARGYLHFGYLGRDRRAASRLLEEGFRWALRERGFGVDALLLRAPNAKKPLRTGRVREGLVRWLGELRRPVGILAASDLLARMLLDACGEQGLRVPDDVGIVGAGNDPALCLAPPVQLTSIEFGHERIGYRAAARLDQMIRASHELRATSREPEEGPQAACDKPQAAGPEPPTPNADRPTPLPAAATGNEYVSPGIVGRGSTDREFLHDAAVAEAVRFIAAECHRPLSVGEVAEAAGVSVRQLRRRFERFRRRSVTEEVARARLRRARDLLEATELPVAAVARALGFASDRNLRRLFRRLEGSVPSAYRRGRGRGPRRDVFPLEQAKRLLEQTDEPVDVIAALCGFRTRQLFSGAFRQQEGVTPAAYRARRAGERAGAERYEVHITLDDG